jgi:hypothetical protein
MLGATASDKRRRDIESIPLALLESLDRDQGLQRSNCSGSGLVTPIDRTLLFCPHRESPHQLQLTR